ncbi:MAG: nucleotidyltransferase family protein [Eubacterium sp.]|nr:nucleotidyltransferase family protein [Eubacterium sp.]
MKYCAVITAAGCSSRMGTFKPVLPVAGRPAIIHLTENLFAAGVSHIVVVTGFRSDLIQELLQNRPDISTVHNPDYQTTQMFDSAKIGLREIPEEYDQVLLIPVDIPFVRENTIRKVIRTDADLVFPSYQMRRGHPLKIHRKYIPHLLQYEGTNGLRGALNALPAEPSYVVVDDPFIIRDMDTPQDYQTLLQEYRHQEDFRDDNAAFHVELP